MRKYLLFAAALLCINSSKAQFSVAIVGGPQVSSVSPAFILHPDTLSSKASSRTGLRFGFTASVPVNQKQSLFFQTGVLYSQKGSRVLQSFDTTNVDISERTLFTVNTLLDANYIEMPLNLIYKVTLKGKTRFMIGAGLVPTIFYNGSTQLNKLEIYKSPYDTEVGYEFEEKSNNDLPVGKSTDQFKLVHFAANATAGLEFGRVFINAHYTQDINNFYEPADKGYKFTSVGASLGIFLGSRHKPAPVVTDSDGDGIEDAVDACPTEAGTIITKGCSDADGDGTPDKDDQCPTIAGTVANKGCPADKDGDSIPDDKDQCPDVPGIAKYHGCPVPDTDNDGTNDEEDKCPTIAGPKHNNGCPEVTREQISQVAEVARQIQFDFNKAELTEPSKTVLNEVVQLLKENTTLQIRVEGHTSGADNQKNLILSEARAQSVKAYLIESGIAEQRITAVGFGSKEPLSTSTEPAEVAKNRRVELKLY